MFNRIVSGVPVIYEMNGNGTSVKRVGSASSDLAPDPSPNSVSKIAFVHGGNIWTDEPRDRPHPTHDRWGFRCCRLGGHVASLVARRQQNRLQPIHQRRRGGRHDERGWLQSNRDRGRRRHRRGNFSVDWSPDGSTIMYDAYGELWTVPANGGAAAGGTDDHPSYSPDGSYIVDDHDGDMTIEPTGTAPGYGGRLPSGSHESWGNYTCVGTACGPAPDADTSGPASARSECPQPSPPERLQMSPTPCRGQRERAPLVRSIRSRTRPMAETRFRTFSAPTLRRQTSSWRQAASTEFRSPVRTRLRHRASL